MNELSPALAILNPDHKAAIAAITDELRDTWTKRQIFRTEWEARMSVLDDGKHPTYAAKYWQAVREQGVMLHELVMVGFDHRRNAIKQAELKEQIESAVGWEKEKLMVDLDEAIYTGANMAQIANDRARELLMWSQLKEECVKADPGFDTTDPNTHQVQSLPLRFERRVSALGESASADERFNAISLFSTSIRVCAEQQKKLG